MLNSNTTPGLPIWPSGIARLDDRVLEVTTGGGIRAAAHDIVETAVEPCRGGRLSLVLRHRAGLDRVRTSYWVEPEHEAAVRRLVDAVATTKGQA